MSRTDKFIVGQWRAMKWIWKVFLVMGPTILAINFADASSADKPLPWMDIPVVSGILLWATAIMWMARRWFNFMLGHEGCKWRNER